MKTFNLRRCLTAIILFACIPFTNAMVISGDLTTAEGKSVDLSGLEWMSFDHEGFSTLGVAYEDIASYGSKWSLDGWRYASYEEVGALNTSFDLIKANDAGNDDGVSFLLGLWDSYTQPSNEIYVTWSSEPNYTSFTTAFNRLYGATGGYDSNGNLIEFGWAQYIGSRDITKTFDDPNTHLNSHATTHSSYFTWENFTMNPNARPALGSFLVRETQLSVPEPSTMFLFGIGLFGLICRRSKIAR